MQREITLDDIFALFRESEAERKAHQSAIGGDAADSESADITPPPDPKAW